MELENSAILDLLEGLDTQDGAGRLQQLELLQASLEYLLVFCGLCSPLQRLLLISQ